MKQLSEAFRQKIKSRMGSTGINRTETGGWSNLIQSDEISVIDEASKMPKKTIKSPDKIIIDLDTQQDNILDMLDTEFFAQKKSPAKKPPAFARKDTQASEFNFDTEKGHGDIAQNLNESSAPDLDDSPMKKSFFSTNPLSGNVRPGSQQQSAFMQRRQTSQAKMRPPRPTQIQTDETKLGCYDYLPAP